jgi:hypothetical protein
MTALRDMIVEAHDILRTTKLQEGRSERAYELLTAAVHLSNKLISDNDEAANDLAAVLGMKGGKKTATKGADYFRKIAGMRKEKKGGRPRKQIKPN